MTRRTDYRKHYLQSPEWKMLKAAKRKRDPQRCAVCAETSGLVDCHHLIYRDLLSVTVKDLLWLCRRCHTIAEGLKRRRQLEREGEPAVIRFHTIELVRLALGADWWTRPKGDTDGSAERRDPDRRRCMATTRQGRPCPTMAHHTHGKMWYCHVHHPNGKFRQQQVAR